MTILLKIKLRDNRLRNIHDPMNKKVAAILSYVMISATFEVK